MFRMIIISFFTLDSFSIVSTNSHYKYKYINLFTSVTKKNNKNNLYKTIILTFNLFLHLFSCNNFEKKSKTNITKKL